MERLGLQHDGVDFIYFEVQSKTATKIAAVLIHYLFIKKSSQALLYQ